MSDDRASASDDHWPADLRGVTETVVATRGPNDSWNHAALGVHARTPDPGDGASSERGTTEPDDGASSERGTTESTESDAVTAFTYGRTRTWRNFHARGGGVVQFTIDPVDFAEAALGIHETDDAVLDSADAWVRVEATPIDATDEDGTRVETWRLDPVESEERRRVVPVVNRGHAAVVDATVAASRIGVPGFDDDALRERLDRAVQVAATCGGPREHEAIRRVAALADDWTPTPDLPGD
ncbi:DUF447 family protein [Halorubellus sp. JP-L1]|uniref:DUF447 domain-containing protein n=1 Tax=Halorubellus sp. JP-L1 TaxID=2715753 RepID=UPI00140A0CE0|nr:DUF447 family protein [Halorubellus sp. JP-L1]